MGRLENKVAIITGSGAGMGKAAAKMFAKEGAKVAVVDWDEAAGTQVAKEIHGSGGDAHFWFIDVSKEDSVKTVFKKIHDTFGKIDILINNAGITGVDNPTDKETEENWDKIFAVDTKGVFFCTKHVIPYMRENGQGSIVNTASIYGLIGTGDLSAYHAAKGAVIAMTKQDAITYAKDKIRVNCMLPGIVVTELLRKYASMQEGGYDVFMKEFTKDIPLCYPGEPDDIAYGHVFLASDESRFMTGALFVMDGGQIAH